MNSDDPRLHSRRSKTVGAVLHSAAVYDLTVWLATLGRDGAFRKEVLDLARVAPGETVLDVACGTGNLAIAASGRVGPTGTVYGVDASTEMVGRARRKAARKGATAAFSEGIAQQLPFPDAQMDLVLSTRAFHHLSTKGRAECIREMRRVLRPGGRLLVVDFIKGARRHGPLAHFHRHGSVRLEDLAALAKDSGFRGVESGLLQSGRLGFVFATAAS